MAQRVRVTPDRDTRDTGPCQTRTVGAAVVAIGAFGFPADDLANVQSATLTVFTDAITFLLSGDDPTATFGIYLAAGQTATLAGNRDINRLRMIRVTNNVLVTLCLETHQEIQ